MVTQLTVLILVLMEDTLRVKKGLSFFLPVGCLS